MLNENGAYKRSLIEIEDAADVTAVAEAVAGLLMAIGIVAVVTEVGEGAEIGAGQDHEIAPDP